jgi:hypothetical protein
MAPDVLVGLLAEPDRICVFAAVVLGAATPSDVARRTGLAPRRVATAMRRLADAGLIATVRDGPVEGRLVARIEVFKEAMREYGQRRDAEPLDADRTRAAVLRAFVVNGRLVSIPAGQGKRRVILEHIVTGFEPGVRYAEREVDAILHAWHPDHASLRRHLVDEEFMAREGGSYWRIGGPTLA